MSNYDFQYKINLDDLDYMGIVGNANWLILLQRARISLCEKAGYSFNEMTKDGVGGVVAEANIRYFMPAYNDDIITVTITPHTPVAKGLSLKYKARNQDGRLCVAADMKIVFVNKDKTSVAMPEKIRSALFTEESTQHQIGENPY